MRVTLKFLTPPWEIKILLEVKSRGKTEMVEKEKK